MPATSPLLAFTLAGALVACGAAPAPAPARAPAPAPAPAPTGGAVLVGEIAGTPGFDPRSTLEAAKPQLLACYNEARRASPSLHGKLKLRISVNEAGTVLMVDAEPGGSAADPGLVTCIGEALKAVRFPRPSGSAIVVAPLVFRP